MNYYVKDFESDFLINPELKADKRKESTGAIQRAIDACSKTGGTVITQKNKVYPVGTLVLKSGVHLVLSKGSVLQASDRLSDYLHTTDEDGCATRMEAYEGRPAAAVIYAKGENDISISGAGMIDGVSEQFVTQRTPYHCTGSYYPRPVIIYVEDCHDVVFREFTVKDAPFWTLQPAGCENVLIDGIKILNRLDMANSDGIDPDHCRNVMIRNCVIRCADDCICLKNTKANDAYGPSEHITIENCDLISTSAGFKIGTEGVDDFRNITVRNCRIGKSNRGISIQIRDRGIVQNVLFEDITIQTRRFCDEWWGRSEPICITTTGRSQGVESGTIQEVILKNINCTAENGIFLYSEREGGIKNIRFEAVTISMKLEHKWSAGWYDLRPCTADGLIQRKNSAVWNHGGIDIHFKDSRFTMPIDEVEGFGEFIDDENNGLMLQDLVCTKQ